jgi:mRNA deadenylase 3'-5' endonuclease subunit Ccr4
MITTRNANAQWRWYCDDDDYWRMLLERLAMLTAAAVAPSIRKTHPAAVMSTAASTEMMSSGWSGKVIARIMPVEVSGDYQFLNKPGQRVDPSTFVRPRKEQSKIGPLPKDFQSMGKLTQNALTSEEVRWTTLDVYLYQEDGSSTLDEPLHVHMNRGTQEDASSALARMEISVSRKIESTMPEAIRKGKATVRKQGKANKHPDHTPASSTAFWAIVDDNGTKTTKQIDIGDSSNADFWTQIATEYDRGTVQLSLTPEHRDFVIPLEVDSCPPSVISIRVFENLEGRVFVGVPLSLGLDLLYATHAVVEWYVDGELASSDSLVFTPTEAHLGKRVSFLITPIRPGHDGHGYEEAYNFLQCVEPCPENAVLNKRPEWIRPRARTDMALRVLTFNVLADLNAFHDVRGQRPFYPYCDCKYLERDRRMPMIMKEILAYHADVICLQEVDFFIFETLFQPTLDVMGYQGFYRKKLGSSEGVAMFWSLDKFERAGDDEMQTFAIQNLFPSSKGMTCLDDWKSMDDIEGLLLQDKELRKVVEQRTGHVLQVASLTLKDPSDLMPPKLTLANTHLFYHPMGGHIRLMQMYVVCHHLEKCRKGKPLLFCGDLNSTADSGAVHLMMHRTVPADHHAWENLNTYCWDQQDKAADGKLTPITISLPDSFPVFCSGYQELPPFTHYIREFSGTLDYIWASQVSESESFGMSSQAYAPTLTEEEVTRDVAMPSKVLPSDHVSLVCDLEFQQYGKAEEKVGAIKAK